MSQSESHQEEEFTDFRSQHELTVSKDLIPLKGQTGDQHKPVAVPVDVNVGGTNNPAFFGPVHGATIHFHQHIHVSAGVNPETNRQAAISRGHHETEKDFDEISLDKIEKESEISTPFSQNTVWKATYLSPSGRRTVAVKNCARFKREEALILQKLRHPNIIEFLGVAPLSFDGFAIVAEFAEKGSVYDLIKQHCDDWAHFKKPRWIKWAVEMARGLHYIHQQKYQHGDVKSQNMVITRDDTLKICDFGTARHCESTFTTENIRGSWAWMAPEVIGERHNSQQQTKAKVTHKSDVFSYAVVVWELLTGKEPFAGETTLDFMQATGGQRRRLEIPKECPQTLRDLLTKCWDHDHTKRPRMDEILSRSEPALLSGEWTTCAIAKRPPHQDFQISQSGSMEPIGEALRHVALDDYAAQKEDEFGCTASHDTLPSESGKEMIRPVKSGHSMPVTSTASASDSPQSVVRYAEKLAQCSRRVPSEDGHLDVFLVPLKEESTTQSFCSYSCGVRSGMPSPHKVIMVIGRTGTGKSTLINAMINYILGVKWEDNFRFKLVDEHGTGAQSQAHSQTQMISSYTIYSNKQHQIPFTLTIIDTPGLGNTRGFERDKAIVEEIRDFFTNPEAHGVDHIDAVGFVDESFQARLGPTQRYVFDSILSIFGKDIEPNILLLITFSDGQSPPVLEVVKRAKLPFGKMFKFNNSALFAGQGDDGVSFHTMSWQMGYYSMKGFFDALEDLQPQRLSLTVEVLMERERLEIVSKGLQPQIQFACAQKEHLNEIKKNLEEKQTYTDVENRYIDAQGRTAKQAREEVIKQVEANLAKSEAAVSELIEESHRCTQRLEQIALKPNPVGIIEYLDLLIESEKATKTEGWQTRVVPLKNAKYQENMKAALKNAAASGNIPSRAAQGQKHSFEGMT